MRPFNTRPLALAGSVAFLALGPFDGVEAQDKQELERIERQIETKRQERQILDSERRALDEGVVIAPKPNPRRAHQEHEAVLSRLEDKLPELEKESKIRSAALQERRRQMTGTLAALERLSRNPPQALLLSDASPVNIVRNAILLRAALPTLQARAAALKNELSEIQSIRMELDSRRQEIKVASRTLAFEQSRLNALMGHRAVERRRMLQQSKSVNARLAALNRKAQSLRGLFSNFAKEKRGKDVARTGKKTSPTQQFTTEQPSRQTGLIARNPARGSMIQPARGRVIERFGQHTGTGSSARGATFRTRYRAQVVAPFDGKVVFVGPFKGYGQIPIIQHGGACHTLLAGMQRVDATLGQRLLAGEPIGIMGTQEDGARLYVEVPEGSTGKPTSMVYGGKR